VIALVGFVAAARLRGTTCMLTVRLDGLHQRRLGFVSARAPESKSTSGAKTAD